MHARNLILLLAVLAVLVAGCGDGAETAATDLPDPTATAVEDEGPGTATPPATGSTPRPDPTPGQVEDEGPGTDTAPTPAPDAPSAPRPDPTPGQVEDEGPGTDTPPAGGADVAPAYGQEVPSTWRVTGVSPGSSLNVRSDPDAGGAVVGSFAADAIDIQSTGRIATAGDAVWREVEVPGATVGWVLARYLVEQTPADS